MRRTWDPGRKNTHLPEVDLTLRIYESPSDVHWFEFLFRLIVATSRVAL